MNDAPEGRDGLAAAATELSERLVVAGRNPAPLPVWQDIQSVKRWLDAARVVCRSPPPPLVKAAEWLLDNDRQIERTVRQVAQDLPPAFYHRLARLAGPDDAGLPRVFAIAHGLLRASHLQVSLGGSVQFVEAYQGRTSLTIAELWALPTMLRLACLELLMAAFEQLTDNLEPPFELSRLARVPLSLDAGETIARSIANLAVLSTIPWKSFFDQTSRVEAILRTDPAGVYGRLDFASRDLYRKAVETVALGAGRDEDAVAAAVVARARRQADQQPEGLVGYWLNGSGRRELEAELGYRPDARDRWRRFLLTRPGTLYATLYTAASLLAFALPLGLLYLAGTPPAWALVLAGLVAVLPATAIGGTLTQWLLTLIVEPRLLTKLDFEDGIPGDCATAIIVPVLVSRVGNVPHVIEQLELHRLANPDPALRFVLLSDVADAATEVADTDEALIAALTAGVDRLNQRYGKDGSGPFHLLHRARRFNPGEGVFMGWERKRGKIEQFNEFVATGDASAFPLVAGDTGALRAVRFVVTVDADTNLPPGAVARLVGTLADPINRLRDDAASGRLLSGYTIVQPRIEIAPEDGNRSLFAEVYAGDTTIDIYSRAVSNVYQDLFGEGIFAGKGIYEVASFRRASAGVPENTLLSHDLLEGVKGRAALASDIVLYENFPTSYVEYARRSHRWVRGDWQLLPWLVGRGDSAGTIAWRPSGIDRWKMIDNLRRSLVPPALVLFLAAGWLALPVNPWLWTLVGIAAPAVYVPADFFTALARGRSLIGALHTLRNQVRRWLLGLVFLANDAAVACDAIARTIWRMAVSRRHLMQWVPASEVAAQAARGNPAADAWRRMAAAPVLALLLGVVVAGSRTGALPAAAPLLLLWLASPTIAALVSRPRMPPSEVLDDTDKMLLRRLARRTWLFFETFVGPEDNWLPPDNYQEMPRREVDHRTSPTNIGLMFASSLAAWDLGYVGVLDLATRVRNGLDAIDRMEKYQGHLFNWYGSRTLATLEPRYVSSVDSGNLAVCLVVLRQACAEIAAASVMRRERWDGLLDTLGELQLAIAPLRFEPAERAAAALAQHVTDVRDDPSGWHRATVLLSDADYPALQAAVAGAVAADKSAHPLALHEIQIWLERLNHHLIALRRTFDALLPWIAILEAAPRACSAVAQRVAALLGPEQPLSADVLQAIPLLAAGGDADTVRWSDDLKAAIAAGAAQQEQLRTTLRSLAVRADAIAFAMDFQFLFDREQRLFHIGYNASANRIDPNHYDLLATEARLASYFAIAKHDVPYEHWFHLARPILRLGGGLVLASWNGSMFEYLMPPLFLPSLPDTLLGQSERAAVDGQRRFGTARGIPWGFSESAFAALDGAGHFRYRAFGAPELGLRRDLSQDVVLAPYSTALALRVKPATAVQNLRALEAIGLVGRYGMIEAADFTPRRVPSDRPCAPVDIFMAHHQGMSLVAMANALTDNASVRRFMADPRMRSIELLLRERVPWEAPKEAPRESTDAQPQQRQAAVMPASWRPSRAGGYPQANSLGNGSLATWISDAGGGGIGWRGQSLTRFVPDATCDDAGLWIYLTDRDSGSSWSATLQPTGVANDAAQIVFHPHMAEFVRHDSGIAVRLEVGVAPHDDVDIRRMSVTNEGDRPRRLRITSYAEVALAPPRSDERHPAFSKMFVASELLPQMNGVLFQRRPRDAGEATPVLLHRVVGDDHGVTVLGFETDRRAFLGRNGSTRRPRALTEGLLQSRGWTLDPAMAIDVAVDLKPGEQRHLAFLTMVGGTRESVLELAARYATLPALGWAFTDAATEAAREVQQLELPPDALADIHALASLLIYPHPALRGAPAAIADNRIGQPGLWGMGLSGDFPILLVNAGDAKDVRVLRTLVRAHAYWRKRGLAVDLVILRTGLSAYEEPMRERVGALLQEIDAQAQLGRRGGIHLLFADQVGSDQLQLLKAVALVVLEEGRSLSVQLAAAPPPLRPLPRFEPPVPVPPRPTAAAPPVPQPLRFDNGIGGFSDDGREYVIRWSPASRPPAPWCNVLANEAFGAIVSEAGIGFSWSINSGENRLTPWSNDPVVDPPGEAIYLRDEETAEVWTPTPEPAGRGNPIEVRHGAGYTTWRHASQGLDQTLKVFVPPGEPVKVARLTLTNLEGRNRRLTATYYAEWLLGALGSVSRPHVVAQFESEWPALTARSSWNVDFAERVAFVVSNHEVHDFTTDRQDFLGRDGDLGMPRALTRWGLGRSVRPGADACAAYQAHIELAAGATTEVIFVLGQASSRAEAEALARRWQDAGIVAEAEKNLDEFWDRMLGAVTVRTPDPAVDVVVNRWLLYQSVASRIFARAGFQQAGGAFGFRDQLQDMLAVMWSDPGRARAHILTCAARQFEEGDVLHWWHPPANQGVRTRCSDDLLWLPYAVATYVSATGDAAILAEEVPFLTAPPLKPDENDRYARFEVSTERATLLEHCERALERGLTSGPHGLPLIGAGDWNDGMNNVGPKGRGESVWLAWFIIVILDAYTDMCHHSGRADLADRWRGRAAELRKAVEAAAWDGQWYVRAFDDDGRPWGSVTSEECQIDSIAQSWSVLAGGEPSRSLTAVNSAWRELERGDGLMRLLWPPFDHTPRDPGYIRAYPPGIRENGGQYAHAAAWLGLAHTRLGDGDGAMRVLERINPVVRTAAPADAQHYRGEPYVVAADLGGAEPRVGQAGWTWYSGSAAWTWRLAVEGILGLRLRDGDLLIDPCLPGGWQSYEADIRGSHGTISVRVDDPDGVQAGVADIMVDGTPCPRGSAVAFSTDGSKRHVVVTLRHRAGVATLPAQPAPRRSRSRAH